VDGIFNLICYYKYFKSKGVPMKKTSDTQKDQENIKSDETVVNQASIKDEKPEAGAVDGDSSILTKQTLADNTIKNHVISAMAIGLVPVPIFDLGLLIANQVKMVHSLCKLYEVPFAENRVKSMVVSLVGGSAPVFCTIGLSTGAKLIPGIGTLLGSGIVSTTGGATTYAVGRVFSKHFDSGGTLLSFNSEKIRNIFKKELSKGREAAKEFGEDSKIAANAKAS
jgi:uncharacterized protein (DUF697 family)